MCNKKIQLIIFGVGAHYRQIKIELSEIESIQINAFFDNKEHLRGTFLDGIMIHSPEDYKKIQFDYIILTSRFAADMYEQLIMLGVDKQKILFWGKFKAQFSKRQKVYYKCKESNGGQKNKILIISGIDHTGGAMSAIYAARCLRSEKYEVDLCAPSADYELIQEINKYGIDVIIYDVIPYIQEEEWIKKYRIVIVNTFQNIQCAFEISKYRPVLWWIHEPEYVYNLCLMEFSEYANTEHIQNINVYAVSDIAWRNFSAHFQGIERRVLLYGIPDMWNMSVHAGEKIIFAVIGGVAENKAQDIFLKAVNKMRSESQAEFWLIGSMNESDYGCQIIDMAEKKSNVIIKGLLTREEMYNIFPQIDVVVCPSREETMSIAINEGMMFGKVCITTDNTGVADYIRDGINGFVVPVGDDGELSKRMQWIMDNRNQMKRIGENARKTFEEYFAMGVFEEKINKAVQETIERWERRD
ncbi:MAG: glycosyltransferase family 4 protein [Lachnospiraceae bacterium]|nr:glycosyltransferase family 4 protein [Lachnospiraceae bacterium]